MCWPLAPRALAPRRLSSPCQLPLRWVLNHGSSPCPWEPSVRTKDFAAACVTSVSLRSFLALTYFLSAGSIWASQVALTVKNPPTNSGDRRDAGSIPGWGRSPGGGNGNPLQYSCLENPMDGGAWWSDTREPTLHAGGIHADPHSKLTQTVQVKSVRQLSISQTEASPLPLTSLFPSLCSEWHHQLDTSQEPKSLSHLPPLHLHGGAVKFQALCLLHLPYPTIAVLI